MGNCITSVKDLRGNCPPAHETVQLGRWIHWKCKKKAFCDHKKLQNDRKIKCKDA